MEQKHSLRIVVKVGTGVLTRKDDACLDEGQLQRLAEAIARIISEGHEVLLVSSGAVGAGLRVFGLSQYPEATDIRQACAAVGQVRLLNCYGRLFQDHNIEIAQVLLTHHDFETEHRRERVLSTVSRLLRTDRLLPIINENDTVAVEELKFGDNDRLASQVAILIRAELLILLTCVDGLLACVTPEDQQEGTVPQLIAEVTDIDAALDMVEPTKGRFAMGGMASKLEAIRAANTAGIPAIIANGRRPEQLADLVRGGGVCTRFPI
jgi:glutamate 5-kinase